MADATADELGGAAHAIGVAMGVTSEEQVEAGIAKATAAFGRIDVLVNNAGIQIVSPIEEFPFAKWKQPLAIHLDGAFLTTRAVLRHMYAQGGGSVIYMGSVHSKEGAKHGVRANVICPGFVRRPLVEKQIPEQAKDLGISEADVIRNVMLKETEDGEFTTVQDVAETALFFASFESNALTGQLLVVSRGWFTQ
jgi:3-hydroxybutyrate dehydrogenase